jgi:hypothetical protein
MLIDAFWAVPNAWHITMHGKHSRNGMDGWMNTIQSIFENRGRKYIPTKLWWILASLTVFLFIGLPLTGLTMELEDGFQRPNNAPEAV